MYVSDDQGYYPGDVVKHSYTDPGFTYAGRGTGVVTYKLCPKGCGYLVFFGWIAEAQCTSSLTDGGILESVDF